MSIFEYVWITAAVSAIPLAVLLLLFTDVCQIGIGWITVGLIMLPISVIIIGIGWLSLISMWGISASADYLRSIRERRSTDE